MGSGDTVNFPGGFIAMGDDYYQSGSEVLRVRIVPPTGSWPDRGLAVRLTDGTSFYAASANSSSISIGNITASQGTPALLVNAWPVKLTDGVQVVGTGSAPLYITGSVYVINQSSGGAASNVTAQSGSVTGLLLGGVALSLGNPLPVTGSVSLTAAITGTVGISSGIAVNNFPSSFQVSNFPATQTVTGSVGLTAGITGSVGISGPITGTVSIASSVAVNNFPSSFQVSNFPAVQTIGGLNTTGSATTATVQQGGTFLSSSAPALLVAGQDVGSGKIYPLPVTGSGQFVQVTGSVFVINQSAGGAASNVTAQSGSVTGLLVGGVAVAGSNPVPVTGTVGLSAGITGSVVLASAPTVVQGTSPWVTSLASTVVNSGSVTGLLLGGQAVNLANPIPVTGTISLAVAPFDKIQSGSVTGLLVGGNALSSLNPAPVEVYGVDATGTLRALSVLPRGAFMSGTSTVLLVGGEDLGNGNVYSLPVTGSGGWVVVTGTVGLSAAVTGSVVLASAPQIASGSVTGLLYGGNPASAANPFFVTGSVGLTAAITGSVVLASAPVVNQGTSPWVVSLASTVINSGSVTGLLYGGVAASAGNPIFVTGSVGITALVAVSSSSGIGTSSGTLPTVSVLQGYKDPGGLLQAGLVNNAGSQYVATPGVAGTRRIVGSYRAVVGPLSATVGPMMNIVNPNSGTLTVYLKQIQMTVIPAGTIPVSTAPTMVYGGQSNATLTGTTIASVALSQSYPANSTAVVTSVGSNNAVTNKSMATFMPIFFGSGSTTGIFCPPVVQNLLDHGKENDDIALSPGHAYTVANSGPGAAGYFSVLEISWDEGGPV